MDAPSPRKRGRPRDPERIRRVLEAAAAQFTQLGYDRTSIESVAQASGVSKMTVYSYFPSKEQLFEACIADRCAGLFDLLLAARLDPADPGAALEQVATLFVQMMRDDQVLAVHRMMFASAGVHHEVCSRFYRSGPANCLGYLSHYLAAAAEAGHLAISNPDQAADQFFSLFLGGSHCRALLGLGIPDPAEDRDLIRANVAFFLRACSPATAG